LSQGQCFGISAIPGGQGGVECYYSTSHTYTGDLNGDGKSDILWIDQSGDVAIWLMNGAQISSTAILGNVGTAWTVQTLNAE